jgi:hypothetical protein
MATTVTRPPTVESRLRATRSDLDRDALEVQALELFRREAITHFELGQMLGLDRGETDAFLVDRREYAQCLTLEDLETDFQTITQRMAEHGR